MTEITRIGVDLAKSVIQIHAVDASGHLVTNQARSVLAMVRQPSSRLPHRHGILLRISPVGP